MNLGEKLKCARIEAGVTQEFVSHRLFVSRQTVSRWEQNKTLPNIYVLKELSTLYEMSIDSLIADKQLNKKGNIGVKKVNVFALVGSLLFNIFLFSGIGIIVVILLLSLWTLVLILILAPFILIAAELTGMQHFDRVNGILSVILCPLGMVMINFAKKWSITQMRFFKKYWQFNMRTIFQTN